MQSVAQRQDLDYLWGFIEHVTTSPDVLRSATGLNLTQEPVFKSEKFASWQLSACIAASSEKVVLLDDRPGECSLRLLDVARYKTLL